MNIHYCNCYSFELHYRTCRARLIHQLVRMVNLVQHTHVKCERWIQHITYTLTNGQSEWCRRCLTPSGSTIWKYLHINGIWCLKGGGSMTVIICNFAQGDTNYYSRLKSRCTIEHVWWGSSKYLDCVREWDEWMNFVLNTNTLSCLWNINFNVNHLTFHSLWTLIQSHRLNQHVSITESGFIICPWSTRSRMV